VLSAGGANFWVAAERLKSARLLYPDAAIAPAIDDYDRILSLDKQDKASFHDRGLSKMFLDRDYDAISDFSSAIQIQPRELLKHDSYESRADAYMKTRQWDLAIRDLTTAISLQVGGGVLLMNIDQFRAIYPEYNSISNEAIARKLQQTFYPNLNYEDFAKGFFAKRALPSTVIPDLYLKRSDAYLKSGNWRWAAIEFHRAIKGFPDYADAVERWRALDSANGAQNYIDMRTFNDVGSNSISFWIKEVRGSDETGSPYSLMQYELNCDAHRIRQLSLQNYDSSGAPISSRESGPWWPWQAIIPDTLGEMFYSRVCRAS
jgi:tetratricopeptide (TPR) repeat protein